MSAFASQYLMLVDKQLSTDIVAHTIPAIDRGWKEFCDEYRISSSGLIFERSPFVSTWYDLGHLTYKRLFGVIPKKRLHKRVSITLFEGQSDHWLSVVGNDPAVCQSGGLISLCQALANYSHLHVLLDQPGIRHIAEFRPVIPFEGAAASFGAIAS